MAYRIKEVAELAGISIRTLHHYDQIGLLRPEKVNPAGYRLYTDDDLDRLQQILFFKELDFKLRDIQNILDNPGYDRQHTLEAHKKMLIEKRNRLDAIIATVDQSLNSIRGGIDMKGKEMFKAFDMEKIHQHQQKYAEEVRQKYNKETVDECEKRTAKYSQNDWEKIMTNWDEIYQRLADRMDEGPADPTVQQVIGEFRQLITNNFYECTPEIF
ncbi:MAG: MerR family transcriptional regulator, partial [Chitinophagales bacterium]